MYGATPGPPPKAKKKLARDEIVALVLAPSAIAAFVFSLFAVLFGRAPAATLMLIAFGASASVVGIHAAEDHRCSVYLLGFCSAAWCLATSLGLLSQELALSEYWRLRETNSYANVLPTERAAGFADAGKVSFADGATLDVSKAIGFKDASTYCVAPVVDTLQGAFVQFWAVGVDCCPERGGFTCDDAWNPLARSGVVVQDASGEYAAAIKMAEAAYSIASADKHLLVRWVVDPEMVELDYWRVGVAILLGAMLLFPVAFGMAAMLLSAWLHGFSTFFFR
mmetsp:Transcript_44212/g.127753  ORF Transcript_44212/g.127753 Transcript_44212/m.127753 type:complete len:280 (-) Transcript_44212:84-923(-)